MGLLLQRLLPIQGLIMRVRFIFLFLTTLEWKTNLKNSLYANSVLFAEIADCDQNGRIEKNDGDLLITYYAQAAAGQNPESLINNELSKVVYADITMWFVKIAQKNNLNFGIFFVIFDLTKNK